MEAGWKVASSFSVEPEEASDATTTIHDFCQAVFLAGELRLLRRDIHGAPLWIAIAGTDWGFTDEAFADTAAKVVAAQRGFFADYAWPYFLISVIPVGRYNPRSTSKGGTGLTNSFAIFMTPKTGLALDEDGRGVPWLLSHELFHLWNGHRYRLEEPDQLGYWFSEGFTDYYARRLLLRAGPAEPARVPPRPRRQRRAVHAGPGEARAGRKHRGGLLEGPGRSRSCRTCAATWSRSSWTPRSGGRHAGHAASTTS